MLYPPGGEPPKRNKTCRRKCVIIIENVIINIIGDVTYFGHNYKLNISIWFSTYILILYSPRFAICDKYGRKTIVRPKGETN